MARPASVRTAARGKGSGPSAASTAWKERVRRSPRASGAPGSSSVQAKTPAAAAASGRTSGRINRRQTWRRLAPAPSGVFAGRADLRQRMGRCHRHQRHTAREPQPDPAEPAPPVTRRGPGPDRDPRPGFRRPEQPSQPDRPEHRGEHQRREGQRGERGPPPEPPARRSGQAHPHRQGPHRHHARDRDAIPEAVPDERIPHRECHRKCRDPDDTRRTPVEHRRRDQPRHQDQRDEPDPSSPRVPALGSNPCQ